MAALTPLLGAIQKRFTLMLPLMDERQIRAFAAAEAAWVAAEEALAEVA